MKWLASLFLLVNYAGAEFPGKKTIHDKPPVVEEKGRTKSSATQREPAILNLQVKDPGKENPAWPWPEAEDLDKNGKLIPREYYVNGYGLNGKTVFLEGGKLRMVLYCGRNPRLLISGAYDMNSQAVASNPKDRDFSFANPEQCESVRKSLQSRNGQALEFAVIETRGSVVHRLDILK